MPLTMKLAAKTGLRLNCSSWNTGRRNVLKEQQDVLLYPFLLPCVENMDMMARVGDAFLDNAKKYICVKKQRKT